MVEEERGEQELDDEEEAVVEDEDDEFEHFQVSENSKLVVSKVKVSREIGGSTKYEERL